MRVVRIATVNIHGLNSATKSGMLTDFLYKHDIDIIFLQEVTRNEAAQIRGYETYLNIETTMHDTAILMRNTTMPHQVQIIPC
jgi:exonuclease III